MSPASRVARLALAEKGVPYTLAAADDALAHLPVLVEDEGIAITGLWAIFDHVESAAIPSSRCCPRTRLSAPKPCACSTGR